MVSKTAISLLYWQNVVVGMQYFLNRCNLYNITYNNYVNVFDYCVRSQMHGVLLNFIL